MSDDTAMNVAMTPDKLAGLLREDLVAMLMQSHERDRQHDVEMKRMADALAAAKKAGRTRDLSYALKKAEEDVQIASILMEIFSIKICAICTSSSACFKAYERSRVLPCHIEGATYLAFQQATCNDRARLYVLEHKSKVHERLEIKVRRHPTPPAPTQARHPPRVGAQPVCVVL